MTVSVIIPTFFGWDPPKVSGSRFQKAGKSQLSGKALKLRGDFQQFGLEL